MIDPLFWTPPADEHPRSRYTPVNPPGKMHAAGGATTGGLELIRAGTRHALAAMAHLGRLRDASGAKHGTARRWHRNRYHIVLQEPISYCKANGFLRTELRDHL